MNSVFRALVIKRKEFRSVFWKKINQDFFFFGKGMRGQEAKRIGVIVRPASCARVPLQQLREKRQREI
jgi:hypothetical protein